MSVKLTTRPEAPFIVTADQHADLQRLAEAHLMAALYVMEDHGDTVWLPPVDAEAHDLAEIVDAFRDGVAEEMGEAEDDHPTTTSDVIAAMARVGLQEAGDDDQALAALDWILVLASHQTEIDAIRAGQAAASAL